MSDNLIFTKGLPGNLDAERFVLGSILLNESAYVSVAERLKPADFILEKHRRILTRMIELFERGEHIDRITIADELTKHGQIESVGGLAYLVSLDDGLPEIANLDSYVRIVKDKSTLRKLIFRSQQLIDKCLVAEQEPGDIITAAENDLREISAVSANEEIITTRSMIEQEGPVALLSPKRVGDIELPISKLNETLGGLGGGQMIVLMARTSRGKSSLAYQFATAAALKKTPPVIWTLEMSPREVFQCIVQQLSGVWPAKYALTLSENEAMHMAALQLYDNWIYLDNKSRTVGEFVAKLHRIKQKQPLGMAIVDHLQLIRSSGYKSRVQEVSENSRCLKLAAQDLDIPFLVLSQVDRASVKGEGKIGLHSSKESGDVENDADVVLWIEAEEEFAWNRDTLASLTIGKNRMGPAGVKIQMLFRPSHRAFLEVRE